MAGRLSEEQYTGIIKTMPAKFLLEYGKKRFIRDFVLRPNESDGCQFVFNISGIPKYDVLHFYLLIGGRIRHRANIFEFCKPHKGFLNRETELMMSARAWVITGPPVIRAPFKIDMKGFRGFRYTEDLW